MINPIYNISHFRCWMNELMVHWMLEVDDGGIDLGVWTINWVYRIPCIASVIGSAVFLMLIIGVLVFKLSSPRLPAPSAGA